MRHVFSSFLAAAIFLLTVSDIPAVERMSVAAETANIRSGPGLQYAQLWKIEKHHPILVIEKKGEWYRFKDFDGDQGWINASLVDKTPAVIVKAPSCPIRKAPSSGAAVLFTVEKGIPFKLLQRKGQWSEIQHADGDKGWVQNSMVW